MLQYAQAMIKRVYRYLNPIERLGIMKYSFVFPLIVTSLSAVILELFAYYIFVDPEEIGLYAIFVFIGLILYFAFRDGTRGGCIATIITISYYFYIIYSRKYSGDRLESAIETTFVLAVLYFILAGIVGWLKETIDTLIEREADEKRRLQTIIQQLPVGVMITDSKGYIVQANKQLEVILGKKIPKGFAVARDKITTLVLEDGKPVQPSQNVLSEVLNTGKAVVGREFVIKRDNETSSHVQVNAAPVHNKDGKVIAASAIVVDATEQKEIESRKDDFVNMASHELKTPITSMKLYLDVLINRVKVYNDERTSRTLINIKNQTLRLQKLVEDLLDVSRLQTGKLTFTREKFRLDTLLEEVVEILQATTDKQHINFVKRQPISIEADKFRIYQVITNLITNAIKYSRGQHEINVSIYSKGTKAIISVQDFGIGIAENQQDKIFERLYQVSDDKEKTFRQLVSLVTGTRKRPFCAKSTKIRATIPGCF